MGLAGADGTDGATGKQGATGPQGPAGPTGQPGQNGKNCLAGADGARGPAGTNGLDAPDRSADICRLFDTLNTAYSTNIAAPGYCATGQSAGSTGPALSLYSIGDTGPAGGIVFYVSIDGMHGLEAAPVDLGRSAWGCVSTFIVDANGTAIGTGALNTAAIIANCPAGSAAAVAASYGPGWFLPSKSELKLLYTLDAQYGGLGLTTQYYWSSSDNPSDMPWSMHYPEGFLHTNFKNNALGVRAVRTF